MRYAYVAQAVLWLFVSVAWALTDRGWLVVAPIGAMAASAGAAVAEWQAAELRQTIHLLTRHRGYWS